jgi:hypothetical protein
MASASNTGSRLTCMTAMIHRASSLTSYITAYGNPLANRQRAGGEATAQLWAGVGITPLRKEKFSVRLGM